ncbi:MAG: DUF4214 domain-containing protein [Planctomycetota bacterium]|nr:DUF4214 domain-containing protein [Planctomycetota bacterium]
MPDGRRRGLSFNDHGFREMLEEELTKAQGQARQLEVEYHQSKGEASKQEEILKRLAEQAMTRQQNVLTEQLKAIIERERAHAEKVEGLREEWRRAEAGIRGEAQAQKKAELEEILRKWEAEREKLEGQLLERAGQLEEARRALDRLREELAERERAHAEKVEGLREEWRCIQLNLQQRIAEQTRLFARLRERVIRAYHSPLYRFFIYMRKLFGKHHDFLLPDDVPEQGLDVEALLGKKKEAIAMEIGEITSRVESVYDLLSLYNNDFIRACYHVILGREPDPEEARHYAQRLDHGYRKIAIIDEILRSKEACGRDINLPGLDAAITRYRNGRYWLRRWLGRDDQNFLELRSLEYAINRIFTRIEELGVKLDEARQASEPLNALSKSDILTMSDEEFVVFTYRAVLGRYPEPAGYAGWISRLKSGLSRRDFLIEVASSEEAKLRETALPRHDQVISGHGSNDMEIGRLSSRARQIYADLKSAMAKRQEEAR